jgi:uncharacterized membrane protein
MVLFTWDFEEFTFLKVFYIIMIAVITACIVVGGYRRFRGTCCLILKVRETAGSIVLQNVCKCQLY